MSVTHRTGCLITLTLVAAACGLLGPEENRVLGRVQDVLLPDSVRQGQSFTVTVITLGGGCSRQGDTEVEVKGNMALITPYDIQIIPRGGTGCTLIEVAYQHVADVEFPTEGDGLVLVRARDLRSDTAIELRHTVTVY